MAAEELAPVGRAADSTDNSKQDNNGKKRRVRVLPREKLCPSGSQGLCSSADAAAFLVQLTSPLSWLKVQDLLYFAQAWHLVWDNELLFSEPILATETGVAIEALEQTLNGRFELRASDLRRGRPQRLSESQKRTLAGIARFYGTRSHFRLSEQIKLEAPWLAARAAAAGGADPVIDPAALHRCYRKL